MKIPVDGRHLPIQTRTESVLIVDDNPDHATLASTSLERSGWPTIDSVATLAEAFDTIKQRHYDLLLIDYCLPDGFGLDLIDWVRQNSAVVIMSGMGSEEIAAEAIKSGANDYLVKNTIFPEVLPDVASQAVDQFRAKTQPKTSSRLGKQVLKVTASPSKPKKTQKQQSTQSRLIQTVSRIREPLTKLLADSPAASPETQAKHLKTALANCDKIVKLIKQTPKNSLP
ncbi:MAG: response regulator [candidate division Zixibacteria bacterium]|nr:response regulator [candidate division Zixibacteria bacterium]